MSTAISFENVSKMYQLGVVGTGMLSNDIKRWWYTSVLNREDPFLQVGQTNERSKKSKGDFVYALQDITFDVQQGDVVGIIGKNGAGKSTLLKLLSRITAPTTGTIKVNGRIASLLEVGTGFVGELTGRENIYMNGSIMGMSKQEIKSKLDEIIDFSGCEMYIDTPVKRYSSGMYVRLGFAIAAFLEPEILVVDEVLAVGDAEFQKKAIGKMNDVAVNGGRTVLFVSHNMAAVRNLCRHGVVLKNGMVDYLGSADAAIDEYLKVYADNYEGLSLAEIPRSNKTNGLIRIIGIKFLNENDEEMTPHCGRFLKIQLQLDVKKTVDTCSVSITIRDVLGNPIMVFPTKTTMDDFKLSQGIHNTFLQIPKLPLTAGQYRLGLWCEAKSPFVDTNRADFIEDAVKLNVEGDFFYPKGVVVGSHLMGKVVLCEHKWEIK